LFSSITKVINIKLSLLPASRKNITNSNKTVKTNMNPFNDNLHLLKEIFGEKEVEKKETRLREIFEKTENKWKENTVELGFKKIKYLLICEAPPYSETGDPIYFYNQINSSFHTRIWKAVYPNIKKPSEKEDAFKMLVEKGFLLIDTTPFAMKYDSKHRKKSAYKEIIKNNIPYLINKLENNFEIDTNLKIAFGFKLNAKQFISVTNGKLKLKDLELNFNEHNIATDGSGFTNSNKPIHILSLN